jgi:hypothetical protein
MTTLKVTIDNAEFAKILAGFLKSIKQVKEVSFETSSGSLTESDWVVPGRKATSKELEELARLMENDTPYGSMNSRQLKQEIKKWTEKDAK